MPQKIKASVSYGVGKGFAKPEEVVIDDPKGHEVLVDVKGSGLCHSDLNSVEQPGYTFPIVMGHEVAGIVEAVGPDVKEFHVGDHVVASLEQACGHCRNCMDGQPESCLHPEECLRAPGDTPRLSFPDGRPIVQLAGIGGFAEKSLIHENQLAIINEKVNLADAACLGCATITGAGAAINTAKIRPGDSVAVIGTGGVGLNVIQGARLAGAKCIIAIDVFDSKLEFARRFGATDVVNSKKEDPIEAVRRITGGGVDSVFEVIGLPATIQQGWQMLGVGGTLYCIGMAPAGTKVELPMDNITMLVGRRGIRGVLMGSTNIKHDLPMYADLIADGRFDMHDLVSQHINLSQIDDAYEQLKRGEVIRSVITEF